MSLLYPQGVIYDLKSPQESLNGQLYNKQTKESFIRDTESVRDRFWIKSRDFWETANVQQLVVVMAQPGALLAHKLISII
jgi:hypothetical protein